MKSFLAIAVLLAIVVAASADTYLQTPRGSNNRCDEQNNDRQTERLFNSQNNAAGGYAIAPQMYYYSGSVLSFEWTNQHACGSNGNTRCNFVYQYACSDTFKDGTSTDTTGDNGGNTCTTEITEANQDATTTGRHESFQYFTDCKTRARNTRLFNAVENVQNNNGAQNTRQNPGGDEDGFECQEERDYWPYWHPTPFVDIAVLTTNTSRCDWYQANSENKVAKNYCSSAQYNNEATCTGNGGTWASNPSHGVAAPKCEDAPWTRDNQLSSGSDGFSINWNWTLPTLAPSSSDNCFMRLRYNISTGDYDDWNTDAGSNGQASPIKDDPYVPFGSMVVRLAIDTNQFGRTFEDRSYMFQIRPNSLTSLTSTIYNLGVRGKRGNIAQVRNCVEYDFTPQRLRLGVGDFVHFQWTGSNHNNNGNAGEGRNRWDRSNIMQVINNDMLANYPEGIKTQKMFSSEELAYRAAFIDQESNPGTTCKTLAQLEQDNDDQDTNNCALLNGAPTGYFDLGVLRMNKSGVYNYISSRNNNFSNRSQKGVIIVKALSLRSLILIIIGAACLGIGGAAGGIYLVSRRRGGFAGFRSTSSFGSRGSSSGNLSSGRSHGSHRSKSSKGSFGGSMI